MNEEFDVGLAENVPSKMVLDPERDRDNWPVIHIEEEDSKPNYEFVGVHGTLKDGTPFSHELRIMRGVDVPVPPSAVYALRDAVSTQYSQGKDPATGRTILRRHNRSSVPWRLVKPGKYLK